MTKITSLVQCTHTLWTKSDKGRGKNGVFSAYGPYLWTILPPPSSVAVLGIFYWGAKRELKNIGGANFPVGRNSPTGGGGMQNKILRRRQEGTDLKIKNKLSGELHLTK